MIDDGFPMFMVVIFIIVIAVLAFVAGIPVPR